MNKKVIKDDLDEMIVACLIRLVREGLLEVKNENGVDYFWPTVKGLREAESLNPDELATAGSSNNKNKHPKRKKREN